MQTRMPNLILFVLLCGLVPLEGLAQKDTTVSDFPAARDTLFSDLPQARRSSRITVLKDQVLGKNYWGEKFRGNWSGIFLGISGLTNTDYSLYPESQQDFFDPEMPLSWVVDLNLLQLSQGLQRSRNTIGVITGLGLEFQSWKLDKKMTITEGPTHIEPLELPYDDPKKSKLAVSYLNIPLLIEFQIPIKEYGERLYFSSGVILSKRLSTHTKVKYVHQGKHYKLKSPDDYYLRNYHYSATFRMGYRWINLFATCDLQPLFNGDKGPEVFPYTIGLALISF